MRHGLYSDRAIVAGEDSAAFEALREGIMRRLRPGDALERVVADRFVLAAWKLRRLQGAEGHLFEDFAQRERDSYKSRLKRYDSYKHRQDNDIEPPVPLAEPMDPSWLLQRQLSSGWVHALSRLEQALERSMHRALAEVRRLQKERREQQIENEASEFEDPLEEERDGEEAEDIEASEMDRSEQVDADPADGAAPPAAPADAAAVGQRSSCEAWRPAARDKVRVGDRATSKMKETNPPRAQASVSARVINPTKPADVDFAGYQDAAVKAILERGRKAGIID
jgi:hypothetical protein